MKRTHTQAKASDEKDGQVSDTKKEKKAIKEEKEESSNESSDKDKEDPHPNLRLVEARGDKEYICLLYYADGGGAAACASALLEVDSLEPERLQELLDVLKMDEQLAKYVTQWVSNPDETEDIEIEIDRHLLCGNWADLPGEREKNKGPFKIAFFVITSGDW